VFRFQKVGLKSNFAEVGIWYVYDQIHTYAYKSESSWISYSNTIYTIYALIQVCPVEFHIPTQYIQYMHIYKWVQLNFMLQHNICTYTSESSWISYCNTIYTIYAHIQVSPVEFHIPTQWKLTAATWPPRHLCYRSTVFFHHLHLFVSFFSQEKNSVLVSVMLLFNFLMF
jgi:hypothetical protein